MTKLSLACILMLILISITTLTIINFVSATIPMIIILVTSAILAVGIVGIFAYCINTINSNANKRYHDMTHNQLLAQARSSDGKDHSHNNHQALNRQSVIEECSAVSHNTDDGILSGVSANTRDEDTEEIADTKKLDEEEILNGLIQIRQKNSSALNHNAGDMITDYVAEEDVQVDDVITDYVAEEDVQVDDMITNYVTEEDVQAGYVAAEGVQVGTMITNYVAEEDVQAGDMITNNSTAEGVQVGTMITNNSTAEGVQAGTMITNNVPIIISTKAQSGGFTYKHRKAHSSSRFY